MNKLKFTRQVPGLIITVLLLTTFPVLAAIPPDAGIILRGQEKPELLPAEKQSSIVEVTGQQEKNLVVNGPKIQISGIHITGQTLYNEDKLLSIVGDSIGKELSLNELESLAGRLTQYLRVQGYPVASAYIPAQDIKDGIVEIVVVVGRYGRIDIRNHSRLTQDTANGLFSSVKSGDYIEQGQLERTLLLVNDTSGIRAKATLTPGAVPGTSDLIVDISDTGKNAAQLYANNWGNRFTGKNQFGFGMNINNLNGIGDMVNLGGAYSGTGMDDYSVSYLLPTGSQGAKFGVGYSRMHYKLGKDFASLNASGTAKTASIFETFTFLRSRDNNLSGRIEYDNKQLMDQTVVSMSEKRAGVLILGVNGDSHDQFAGGGINSFSFTYSSGHLSMRSAKAQANDVSAQTAGNYRKTNLNVGRVQRVNDRLNLYLSFMGQLANKNLDSSEKISIGGPNAVRAYPTGEASSDEGYVFTSEFRWNLPTSRFQLATFFDTGKAILNKNPWSNAEVNSRILSGAGLGLIWNRANDYSIRLDYAWKITTSELATSDIDKSGRFWLQCVKYY